MIGSHASPSDSTALPPASIAAGSERNSSIAPAASPESVSPSRSRADDSVTGSSSESPRPSSSSSEISMPCSVPSFLKSVARLIPYDPSFFDWQEARSG
jgi:hypothetical protein